MTTGSAAADRILSLICIGCYCAKEHCICEGEK